MQKIPKGYVLQPRIFDGSEASKMSPVTRELWFYLLRNVNKHEYKNLKSGQGFFRFSDIQEALSWFVGYRKMVYSKPQLTKALRRLNEGNMTATMKATHGIVITVCNYEYYQDPKNYEGNGEGSTKEQRRKSDGHNIYKKEYKKEQEEQEIKKKIKKKSFSPPIREEVISYFLENGFSELAGGKAFDYYDVAGWKDSRGNQVKNWKQKMRGVWFKDENKINGHVNGSQVNYGKLSRSEQNALACQQFIEGAGNEK